MKTLLRHPFFILLQRFWYLPLFILAAVWEIGGATAFEFALWLLLLISGTISGILASALLYGQYKKFQANEKRLDLKQQFLCPSGLHFDQFKYACGNCLEELDPFLVDTEGKFGNTCAQCQQQIFDEESQRGIGFKAYCGDCYQTYDPKIYHQRSISITATILAPDFESIYMATETPLQVARDNNLYLCRDTGTELNYILNCDLTIQSIIPFSESHAINQIGAIWFDAGNADELTIGRAFDAFVRRYENKSLDYKKIVVKVRQQTLSPSLKNRLENIFAGIQYGVEPEILFQSKNTVTPSLLTEISFENSAMPQKQPATRR